jgi:hypothetical protein
VVDGADPDEKTVASAVSVLQFELALVNGSIDSLDRKAALIPPFLVAAAALLLDPAGMAYNGPQLVFIGLALVTGVWASYLAYKALTPDVIRLGPSADAVAQHTNATRAAFDERVVEALSEAVQETSRTTLSKGLRLTRGLKLAGATLLLLVFARIAGGISLADNTTPAPQGQPTQVSPTPQPTSQPTSQPTLQPTLQPATEAPATPAASPTGPSSSEPLPSFGQQIAAKGGQLADAERRVIEKGG